MIQSVEEMIARYVAAWNEPGLPEFKRAFAEVWAEEAMYTDPEYRFSGVDAIAALAQASLEKFPGRTFEVHTQPEHHNNCGRYNWKVNLQSESREGFDFFEFNDEYKITRIVSFF